ncbi:MAG: aminopeptidase [Candidatus Jordarchaeales archaeon]
MRHLELLEGAVSACRQNLAVKEGENVVVVVDPEMVVYGEAFAYAAEMMGADVTLALMKDRGRHGAEPPRPVAAAMEAADVFILTTTHSLSHTEARRRATERGGRGASLPGVTKQMFLEPMMADYGYVKRVTEAVASLLDRGEKVRLTSPSGTDLTLSLEGRVAMRDDGDYTRPGLWGNLPAGEACIAPVESEGEGVLVMEPVGGGGGSSRITIKDGRAVGFKGEEARRLEGKLREVGGCAFQVAELGVGTNPKARLVGNVLEDEKVMGTVHVAFGDNVSFPGGENKCGVHVDLIVLKPTLVIDGVAVMKEGVILVDL